MGLQGQLMGSQPLILTLLFTASRCSLQTQLPVHNLFPCSGHLTLYFSHPIPKQPPPCSISRGSKCFSGPRWLLPFQLLRKQAPTLVFSQPKHTLLCPLWHPPSSADATPELVTHSHSLLAPREGHMDTLQCMQPLAQP